MQGKQRIEIQRINQSRGMQEYSWDGKDSQGLNLEAGIYVVQIEFRATGSPIASRANSKIVYLK